VPSDSTRHRVKSAGSLILAELLVLVACYVVAPAPTGLLVWCLFLSVLVSPLAYLERTSLRNRAWKGLLSGFAELFFLLLAFPFAGLSLANSSLLWILQGGATVLAGAELWLILGHMGGLIDYPDEEEILADVVLRRSRVLHQLFDLFRDEDDPDLTTVYSILAIAPNSEDLEVMRDLTNRKSLEMVSAGEYRAEMLAILRAKGGERLI